MTPRESSLWKWLLAGKPNGCLMERVENSVNPDMPDVVGTYERGAFMAELKVATADKGGVVKIKWSSTGQVLFISNWNSAALRTWVLVQVPEYGRYLVSGHYVKHLANPVLISDLRNWTAIREDAISMQIISKMAGK